ncbi:MAG: metalloregulator ArsR/SmtB family transcription factor [Candidatus Pacearchaeota archaeon]|nr:metalloregulator ArsR/SmtB family transcription factor [Candidatus Pacearchaeota archaeon]
MNKCTCNLNPYLNHYSYHIFFTNLANELKIGIILSLRKKEKNVTEIVKDLKVEQSKISHALISLKKCNIVNVKQKGKKRIYFLNKDTIVPILELIDKHAFTHCKNKCCVKENNKEKSK